MSNSQELGHQCSPHAGASAISNQSIVNMWALPKYPLKNADELLQEAIEQGKECDALLEDAADLETKVKKLVEDGEKTWAKAEALDRSSRRLQTQCALLLTRLVAFNNVDHSTASGNSLPSGTRASSNSGSRRSHHGRSRTLHGRRGSDYDAQ